MYPENLQDDKTLVVQSLNFGREDKDVIDITDRGVQDSLMNDEEVHIINNFVAKII